MRRTRLIAAAIAVACVSAFALAIGFAALGGSEARGASETAPAVTLDAPVSNADTCSCLRGSVPLDVTATPSTGRTITTVVIEYSPAGSGNWTPLHSFSAAPFHFDWDVRAVPAGVYDLRAVATDSDGETGQSAIARDRVVATGASFLTLSDPGDYMRRSVQLAVDPEVGASVPSSVEFQRSPAGAETWTKIGDADPELDEGGAPTGRFVISLDTTALSDGRWDFRALGHGQPGEIYVNRPQRDRLVDNTAPVSALARPGESLSGVVGLHATSDDAGSGLASVRFEWAPSGSSSWTSIAALSEAPFNVSFDTRALLDGRYDFRVVATDKAGNVAPSPIARAIPVSNSARTDFGQVSIQNMLAPAKKLSLLGQIAGSHEHETWAYGFTNGPPALVNGGRLPYTAAGNNQLVLLRYTDSGGWQVTDVPRNADGSAFSQIPGGDLKVTGQMTPSGEAWLAVSQRTPGAATSQGAIFHRSPGGRFLRDADATAALGALMSGRPGLDSGQMRLGVTSSGGLYGTLLVPNQPLHLRTVPAADGDVQINSGLDFGLLADGQWTVQTADLPSNLTLRTGEIIKLATLDASGPRGAWAAVDRFTASVEKPLLLGRLDAGNWTFAKTGLDALDLTAPSSADTARQVRPIDLRVQGRGVWLRAEVDPSQGNNTVVARIDSETGRVTASWCGEGLPLKTLQCAGPLDSNHPAAVPEQVFDTPEGEVGVAATGGMLDIYAHGAWSTVAAPGFSGSTGKLAFTSPSDGWLVGEYALGRVTRSPLPDLLAPWPQPNRSTLVAAASPPGGSLGVGDAGALAVGLDGTALRFDPAGGWLLTPVPSRARRVVLKSVAFNGPSSAFAVGQIGTILRWDGASWSEDPQSVSITQSQLNSVAFMPSGDGWAVGSAGTILHYDGQSWSHEQPPAEDQAVDISSVAVAGSDVFAIAGGSLIKRDRDGTWRSVDPSLLPDPAPPPGDLTVLSGLRDGGLVAAGRSIVMVRERAGGAFDYSPQPLQGIAVAAAAFRGGDGHVRSYISIAQAVLNEFGTSTNTVGGYPPGDGELMRQTDTGWQDLSAAQYPGGGTSSEGAISPDPALAVATNADGSSAWVVGGAAGTRGVAGIGSYLTLSARPFGWRSAAIWRYDQGGSTPSPNLGNEAVELPARAKTVNFAFFSAPMCRASCAAVRDAQPDVNLRAAAQQMSEFAKQPGGPAFAVLGGNARGPIDEESYQTGTTAADFAVLPQLLEAFRGLPLFAAIGPRDNVPTAPDPLQPWTDAFAQAPAPMGTRPAPPGIDPAGAGGRSGPVSRYYAFDASQNGATLRVIVLDNSGGGLDVDQSAWLDDRLADAAARGLPVVVVAARPLRASAPGHDLHDAELASKLVNAGVLAVFTTSGSDYANQVNRRVLIPETLDARQQIPQIPEYEGATLGYQQSANNGVSWYSVAVDTANRRVSVSAIPLMSSLALKPLRGLSVARSSTLSFEAVGRRPRATIATSPGQDSFPGFDQYVGIPAANCSGCIGPSYRFVSSDRTIGDFVVPSGPGSIYPKLDESGKPIPSSSSGLFCGFNSGSTTVSVTSGLLRASLPVTVQQGDIGRPCGTVFRPGVQRVVVVPSTRQATRSSGPAPTGTPPPPASSSSPLSGNVLPNIVLPVPAPPPVATRVKPAAKPPVPAIPSVPALPQIVPLSPQPVFSPPVIVPPVPPATQPIPPSGTATSSATSAAKRREKARKHARQSAYVVRPSGASVPDWFYPAVGVAGLIGLLLAADGLGGGPRPRPAFAYLDERPVGRDPRER